MWGGARGQGRQVMRVRTAPLAALVLVLALAVAVSVGAQANALAATGGDSAYSVQRVCGAAVAPAAACTALRLVPGAQAQGALHAGLAGGAAGASGGERAGAPGGEAAEVGVPMPRPGFLTPADLHAAYGLPSETAASGTQTVAVVDAFDDPTAEADLGVYDEQFGLPPCTAANGCLRKVNEKGQSSPLPPEQGEWAGEISIDVQMVHAICQNCHILLVEANSEELTDLGAAVNTAVKEGAEEVSNSYQVPEEPALASFFEELDSDFYEHPGVVVTASAGDCGYLNQACPGKPASTNFPADSPGVVAVGGTTLTEEHESWSSTAWDEGASGCSEIFSAPAWQSAVANFSATGCGTGRSVADVSAVADPRTGVDIYDSTPEGSAPTGWTVFGGTSVSSPIIAAEFALAGGAHGEAFPAATLYSHAGEAGALEDVVSGSNGSCGGASSCQAGVGYDGPTGLGSPLGLGAFAVAETPVLTGFSPASGITGGVVRIEGSGLGAVDGVDFGELPAQFKVVSSAEVEAIVPDGAGKGKISVSTFAARSTSKAKFTPTLSVVSFSPAHAAAGRSVTIKGVGFDSRSTVSFDGTPGHVTSASSKKLKVMVPDGAGAGPIAVTNTSAPVGTVFSAGSFSP
jgi:hypothetical protein